ncbi:MAG: transcription elongation factor GreA [Clostridium sp.]|nr:transcription elongation factor GreA [Clostridium sp.]
MSKKYPMTLEGRKRLEEELTYLKNEKQKEVNDEIKHLRGFCDFSDDATFKEMLDQQSLLKAKIDNIEEMIYNSVIISSKDGKSAKVGLGSTVTFIELPDGEEETYTIVGTIDADPMKNRISADSPIGKSLLGSRVNEEVFIEIPSGKIKMKVLDIH